MSVIHFLNVGSGDCNIIQHNSGHISVIDVSYAESLVKVAKSYNLSEEKIIEKAISGNFNRKDNPENPILYLKKFKIETVFRYIQTHPDMDHMDGIKDFFNSFSVLNFWDTNNKEVKDFADNKTRFKEEDWNFYKNLRDNEPQNDPKRLTLYSNSIGKYFNVNEDGTSGGDGLSVLSPTEDLVRNANESKDFNDCSYVILYRSGNKKILFCGDSHDNTWEHILKNHKHSVSNIDVLFAPHHGRKSDRDFDFLDVLKPRMTLFGIADSKHLAYDAWNNRKLEHITNNQAGNIILQIEENSIHIHVENESYAKRYKKDTWKDSDLDSWYIKTI
jgi:competence protein ComEC